MEKTKTISRREFLTAFPKQLANSMHAIATGNPIKSSQRPQAALLDIERCLAWGNLSCQLCYLACPLRDKAIQMIDQKPVITASLCNGCAQCVAVCKTINDLPAISMTFVSSATPANRPF